VYGILTVTCGASGCHNAQSPGPNAPAFVSQTTPQLDAFAAWTLITSMPAVVGSFGTNAAILSLPASGHDGATFRADQITTITNWLALERAWRTRGSGSGSGSVDLLAQWSGCMQLADFEAADVAPAFASIQTSDGGTCAVCHSANSGFVVGNASNVFASISDYREYLSEFFIVDTSASPNRIVVNTAYFELAAAGGVDGMHPTWNPTNNAGMTALNEFYNLTLAHLDGTAAPACGPSTLSD
jgi:hypothetical protein